MAIGIVFYLCVRRLTSELIFIRKKREKLIKCKCKPALFENQVLLALRIKSYSLWESSLTRFENQALLTCRFIRVINTLKTECDGKGLMINPLKMICCIQTNMSGPLHDMITHISCILYMNGSKERQNMLSNLTIRFIVDFLYAKKRKKKVHLQSSSLEILNFDNGDTKYLFLMLPQADFDVPRLKRGWNNECFLTKCVTTL